MKSDFIEQRGLRLREIGSAARFTQDEGSHNLCPTVLTTPAQRNFALSALHAAMKGEDDLSSGGGRERSSRSSNAAQTAAMTTVGEDDTTTAAAAIDSRDESQLSAKEGDEVGEGLLL